MHLASSLRARWGRLTRREQVAVAGFASALLGTLVLLTFIFHKDLLEWAKPIAQKYTQKPGGFLLPAILLVIVSFPPLFGHEFISILVGFVYGNVGFLIVAVSITVGESLLFLGFRHVFRDRLVAFREKYANYDIFVRVIERGGFPMLLAVRISAIPGHFSTPLFASILTMPFKTWLLACVVSSITLYPPVYFGWLLQRGQSSEATPWLIGFALGITVVVGAWIYIEYTRERRALGLERIDRGNDLDRPDEETAGVDGAPYDLESGRQMKARPDGHHHAASDSRDRNDEDDFDIDEHDPLAR
ncbi:hypothetical protein PYCC9005_005584 [Savitreella phatthalungensis]